MNKKEDGNNRRRRRARGWFPRCCIYEAFRMEDLWSGKIDPDSDIVRAQSENFGPEGYDENGEENNVQVEESQSEDTTSTSTSASSSTSSNKLKKRKIRQES